MLNPRLLYVIPETNFACQHRGLVRQLSEKGIEFSDLKPGDVIAFLNRKETMLRVLVSLPEKNTLGFVGTYKSPHGRVPPEAIQFVTQAMGGDGFNMNKAIRLGLEKLLGKKQRRTTTKDSRNSNGVKHGAAKASSSGQRVSGSAR